MNWADIVILSVLGLSVLIGLFRGLISEVLSLVSWLLAFVVARLFGPAVAANFAHLIPSETGRLILGYILCFVAVLIVCAIVRFMVNRMLYSIGLSGINRLLGMAFGFVRGVLLVALGVFLIGLTGFTHQAWWRESTLLPQFQGVATWLGSEIPANARQYMHPQALLDHLPSLPTTRPNLSSFPSLGGSASTSPNTASGTSWLNGKMPDNMRQYLHLPTMFDQLPGVQPARPANSLSAPARSVHTTPAPAATVF